MAKDGEIMLSRSKLLSAGERQTSGLLFPPAQPASKLGLSANKVSAAPGRIAPVSETSISFVATN